MTNKQTILAFIDRINAHNVEGLGELMSDDHTFIDAHSFSCHALYGGLPITTRIGSQPSSDGFPEGLLDQRF